MRIEWLIGGYIYITIEELKEKLKNKIKEVDRRIEKYETPSSYGWSKKVEILQGEAAAQEKILKWIDNE